MQLYKIDTIIKGELLRHGLSIHSYIKKAYLALRFIRSMNFDSAYYIKTVTATITDNKIDIPDDMIGIVRIGIKTGQYLTELAPDDNLLTNTDPYVVEEETSYAAGYWYPSINKYGQYIGGYFGYSHLNEKSYKILFEENKILVSNTISNDYDEVVLQYHTDGMEAAIPHLRPVPPDIDIDPDLAVYLHPYAVDAMISYIDWQSASEGNRFVSSELKKQYYNELRKYRARINPITINMIKRSLRKNYHAAIKN